MGMTAYRFRYLLRVNCSASVSSVASLPPHASGCPQAAPGVDTPHNPALRIRCPPVKRFWRLYRLQLTESGYILTELQCTSEGGHPALSRVLEWKLNGSNKRAPSSPTSTPRSTRSQKTIASSPNRYSTRVQHHNTPPRPSTKQDQHETGAAFAPLKIRTGPSASVRTRYTR